MADMSGDLPELMQPLLDFLDNSLSRYPYGEYISHLLSTIFVCAYAVSTGLASLLLSIFSPNDTPSAERPEVQKLLPPLMTLLVIYFAIVAAYRTTGYFMRTFFGIVKWSFILAALGVLAGYFIANAGVDGEAGMAGGLIAMGMGFIPAMGGAVHEILNRNPVESQLRTNGRSSQAYTSESKSSHAQKTRPKVYESWKKHQEWQYSEDAD